MLVLVGKFNATFVLLSLNSIIHFACPRLMSYYHFGEPVHLELSSILKAFILLLKRLGSRVWEGEPANYPEVVFDSIKDNPSYLDLLLQTDTSKERPWYFAWYSEFLHTVSGFAAHDAVLAKMIGFMCEELQHERFGNARPDIMCAAVRVSRVICPRFCDEFDMTVPISPVALQCHQQIPHRNIGTS
jgi:hypothetical protein